MLRAQFGLSQLKTIVKSTKPSSGWKKSKFLTTSKINFDLPIIELDDVSIKIDTEESNYETKFVL